MARPKKDTQKRSVNINSDIMEWIKMEAEKNGYDVQAQISMMLSKARKTIEEEREIIRSYRSVQTKQEHEPNKNVG